MRQHHSTGRLQQQAVANQVGGKITVSLNLHLGQLVFLARIDRINNIELIVLSIELACPVSLGIEVAERLEIFPKIATAFIQQVVIHRALLKDGHQLFQLTARHPHAFHPNVDQWPGHHSELIVEEVGIRMVGAADKCGLGLQSLVFLIV